MPALPTYGQLPLCVQDPSLIMGTLYACFTQLWSAPVPCQDHSLIMGTPVLMVRSQAPEDQAVVFVGLPH